MSAQQLKLKHLLNVKTEASNAAHCKRVKKQTKKKKTVLQLHMRLLQFCYSKHNHVYGKHMLTIVCRINNIWLIQVDTKRVGIHHAQIYLHPGGLPTVPEGHHDIFYGVP